jgi:hypothetical protein
MRCPFVYSTGKQCKGYIIRMKSLGRYREIDITIDLDVDGKVTGFDWEGGSLWHLECSQKGRHAGLRMHTPEVMKLDALPEEVLQQLKSRPVFP